VVLLLHNRTLPTPHLYISAKLPVCL
jgi:hypothetical protein